MLWFAMRSKKAEIFKVEGVDGLTEDRQYFLPRGFTDVRRVTADAVAGERFFLAFRAPAFDRAKPPLNFFIKRGFKINVAEVYVGDDGTAYLVEVTR
jgi:hypothetical protein